MSRVDVKVVLLGHEAVGKTSLMERFVNDRFNETRLYQNTIGTAFASKQLHVNDKKLIMGLWDTAGSERYEAMTKIYYRGAAAAIVCYDITNPETFSRAKFWISELRSVEENCAVYLCATKKDLIDNMEQANPSIDVVEKYARGVQSKFFLTSSKTGENIAEIFSAVAEDYLLKPSNAENLADFITLADERRQNRCCFSW